MALAHLAIEYPGWDYLLALIAAKMDNEGCPMYSEFKRLHEADGGKFYCAKHKYNPPENSGLAFCPACEGLDVELVDGKYSIDGIEVGPPGGDKIPGAQKKMPRHQEGRTNEEPPSTDNEAHGAPDED